MMGVDLDLHVFFGPAKLEEEVIHSTNPIAVLMTEYVRGMRIEGERKLYQGKVFAFGREQSEDSYGAPLAYMAARDVADSIRPYCDGWMENKAAVAYLDAIAYTDCIVVLYWH
jgi:hypothetical protein